MKNVKVTMSLQEFKALMRKLENVKKSNKQAELKGYKLAMKDTYTYVTNRSRTDGTNIKYPEHTKLVRQIDWAIRKIVRSL